MTYDPSKTKSCGLCCQGAVVVGCPEHGVGRARQRLTMDEYGLALAHVVKLRAACTRRQVGAVIIGPDKRVLATGYNGVAPGKKECMEGGCPRGMSDEPIHPVSLGNSGMRVPCIAFHAEHNAVAYAATQRAYRAGSAAPARRLDDCTIYISCPPCPDCAELCASYGLRVVHS